MSEQDKTEDTVTIASGIRGDSVTYPVGKRPAIRSGNAMPWAGAATHALHECGCPQHQAADELARLTNDMGMYGPDQEAS